MSQKSRKASKKTRIPRNNISGYDFAGRIKKCCINWQEYWQKWEFQNRAGIELATKIVNERLDHSCSEQNSVEMLAIRSISLENIDDDENKIFNDKERLVEIFHSMKEICGKMKSLTANFEAMLSLYEMKEGKSLTKQPIFETWPLSIFVDLSRKISNMFEHELQLKEKLISLIFSDGNVDDRNKLMACLAMWLHQPYIDDDFKDEMELMHLETGLRTL